jgi:hypothetical protein
MLGHSIVSQHFMEPEGSVPNSQELSTCFYPLFIYIPFYVRLNFVILLYTLPISSQLPLRH